jgi:hypothetical protein
MRKASISGPRQSLGNGIGVLSTDEQAIAKDSSDEVCVI